MYNRIWKTALQMSGRSSADKERIVGRWSADERRIVRGYEISAESISVHISARAEAKAETRHFGYAGMEPATLDFSDFG
jgi:hypothetical protein